MAKTLAASPVYKYKGWDVYQTYNDDGTLSNQIVIKHESKNFVFMVPTTESIYDTVMQVEGMIDREIENPGKYTS
jgi:hypothetical protein